MLKYRRKNSPRVVHRFIFHQDALNKCHALQDAKIQYRYEPGYNEYFVYEYESYNEDLRKAA